MLNLMPPACDLSSRLASDSLLSPSGRPCMNYKFKRSGQKVLPKLVSQASTASYGFCVGLVVGRSIWIPSVFDAGNTESANAGTDLEHRSRLLHAWNCSRGAGKLVYQTVNDVRSRLEICRAQVYTSGTKHRASLRNLTAWKPDRSCTTVKDTTRHSLAAAAASAALGRKKILCKACSKHTLRELAVLCHT